MKKLTITRAFARDLAAQKREHAKKRFARYVARHPARVKKSKQAYAARHPQANAIKARRWYQENRERHCFRNRLHRLLMRIVRAHGDPEGC